MLLYGVAMATGPFQCTGCGELLEARGLTGDAGMGKKQGGVCVSLSVDRKITSVLSDSCQQQKNHSTNTVLPNLKNIVSNT